MGSLLIHRDGNNLNNAIVPESFVLNLILEAIPESEKRYIKKGIFIKRKSFFLAASQQLHFSKKKTLELISFCDDVVNRNRGLVIRR